LAERVAQNYRKAVIAFIRSYAPDDPTIGLWPRNIEL
jgi:hypothetical protein